MKELSYSLKHTRRLLKGQDSRQISLPASMLSRYLAERMISYLGLRAKERARGRVKIEDITSGLGRDMLDKLSQDAENFKFSRQKDQSGLPSKQKPVIREEHNPFFFRAVSRD